MKIKSEHYTKLKHMLDEVVPENFKDHINIYLDKNLSLKRFRWDMLSKTDSQELNSWLNEVYDYADDNHIDTVLLKYFNNRL